MPIEEGTAMHGNDAQDVGGEGACIRESKISRTANVFTDLFNVTTTVSRHDPNHRLVISPIIS